MSHAIITSKGQITIPKDIRNNLKLKSVCKADFFINDTGEAVMGPLTNTTEDVFGILSSTQRRRVSVKEMDNKLKKTFKKNWK